MNAGSGGCFRTSADWEVGIPPLPIQGRQPDSSGVKRTRRMKSDPLIDRCNELIEECKSLREDVRDSRARHKILRAKLRLLSQTALYPADSAFFSAIASSVTSRAVRQGG
jgi:hypothetical protein